MNPASPVALLDIVCGGGAAVKAVSSLLPRAAVLGLDHADEMVRLARRVNRAGIETGKVDIIRGSVHNLPWEDGFFDMVLAFDTINSGRTWMGRYRKSCGP